MALQCEVMDPCHQVILINRMLTLQKYVGLSTEITYGHISVGSCRRIFDEKVRSDGEAIKQIEFRR